VIPPRSGTPMPQSSKYVENQLLFCLQEAAEYRNLAVDGLPAELKNHLLGLAALWDEQADQFLSVRPASRVTSPNKPVLKSKKSLRETLASLSKLAEEQVPGAVAGFALVDGTGNFFTEAVFPSVPDFFRDAIARIPIAAPYTGTCVEAICTGRVTTCDDIRADTRFDPKWRNEYLRNGLKAVQSQPISLGEGTYAGTFVISFREVARAEHWDASVMRKFADLGSDAIKLHAK
jgi:hypothetical protein